LNDFPEWITDNTMKALETTNFLERLNENIKTASPVLRIPERRGALAFGSGSAGGRFRNRHFRDEVLRDSGQLIKD
jgi:hypothetical protein